MEEDQIDQIAKTVAEEPETVTLEKKTKPDKRKQPRSQAQIEATKRLVELRRKIVVASKIKTSSIVGNAFSQSFEPIQAKFDT